MWAYITLGTTGIITEETSPMVGGLAAHNQDLHFTLVVLWVAAGVWAADVLLYYLGRWRGRWVRQRWPVLRGVILRSLRFVRRHPWRSSLAVRFAYGLRFTLPVACGAARIPLAVYIVGSAISSLLWSLVFTTAGWVVGRTGRALGWHPKKYELPFMIAVVVVAIIAYLIARRRHVEEKTVEVLEAD
ncbi:MAG: VTT domain-containing protein [Gemmatimonadota bacterium]|nr:VTT domain-containing protein [Gemmatimonadota bacterium]